MMPLKESNVSVDSTLFLIYINGGMFHVKHFPV